MSRIIYQRIKPYGSGKKNFPITIDVEPVEQQQVLLDKEAVMSFVINHEDEIITYIKDRAVKETLTHLSPLLQKLEEAVQQQQAHKQELQEATNKGGLAPIDHAERLKNLQESFKNKEIKVAKRLSQIQARFGALHQ
ncbi:hypothetical protein [Chryseobacterium sp. GP-SGM7]|uniref:hypothetical protein n=1 Tax=Chryseobacterium sp. GP-SGM7 TaxID=3411323 RepID=UPI003B95563E